MKSIIKLSCMAATAILLADTAIAQTHDGNATAGVGASMNGGSGITGENNGPGTTTGSTMNSGSRASNSSPSNTNGNVSWNTEDTYWRTHYNSRPYYTTGKEYSAYEPAYRYGVDMYNRSGGKSYDQLNQSELQSGWNQARGSSSMNWTDAQNATRDAYNRAYDSNRSAAMGNTPSMGNSGSTNTTGNNLSPAAGGGMSGTGSTTAK